MASWAGTAHFIVLHKYLRGAPVWRARHSATSVVTEASTPPKQKPPIFKRPSRWVSPVGNEAH